MRAPWTLIRASHVVARELAAVFAEVGPTPTQFEVLVEPEDGEPRRRSDLTRGVLLRPQNTGELVAVEREIAAKRAAGRTHDQEPDG